MREYELPSGAILKIAPSPFAVAKALFNAILKEGRGIELNSNTDLSSIYKDLFCSGLTSPEVEKYLKECFKRCTYGPNNLKIDDETFEPDDARQDYVSVCMEVAKENVFPFVKSLFAEYHRILAMIETDPASRLKTTTF